MMKRFMSVLPAVLILVHALICYMGAKWAVAITFAAWIFFARIGWQKSLLIAVPLAFMTLLLTALFWIKPELLYYRPHERLALSDREMIYKKNQNITMEIPFGDLVAMTRAGVREPRRVTFQTDSDGYRNARDYHGQKYVLVGDSFVAANGSSQECTINEQLARKHGMDAYNLGFQGEMPGYLRAIENFKRRHGEDFKVLLFIYEGNDFVPLESVQSEMAAENEAPIPLRRYLRQYAAFWREDLFVFVQNRFRRMASKPDDLFLRPSVASVRGASMAFLGYTSEYAFVAEDYEDRVLGFSGILEKMKPHLEAVFFIPAKYRVYSGFLDSPIDSRPHFNKPWEYLSAQCDRLGIPAVNLTEPLIRRAGELLPEGKYVFWRDDTHWNCHGMEVAADAVAAAIKSSTA